MKDTERWSSTPVPDPTTLTTDALHREIATAKEIIGTRIDGMDKALQLLDAQQSRVPSETSKEITHLKELVWTRFLERDLRTNQQQTDSKDALQAALKSSNAATVKAEESLNKRFDIADTARTQLEERVRLMMPRTESESLHKAHTDRINGLVSAIAANTERREGAGQSWQTIVTVIMAAASIASTIYVVSRIGGSG